MQREILFRGISKHDGQWREGSLLQWPDGTSYICYPGESDELIKDEVLKETVGQYTGRVDLNGDRIFEGDLCAYAIYANWQNWHGQGQHSRMTGEVRFGQDRDFSVNNGHYHSGAFYLKLIDASRFHDSIYYRAKDIFLSETNITWGLEVIGNIYQHPELLTQPVS